MNKEQMLLLKVAEECAELGQVCSKAIRFGLNSKHPNGGLTNFERIGEEFQDLAAAFDYLLEKVGNSGNVYAYVGNQFLERRERIDKYLEVSKKLGILKE